MNQKRCFLLLPLTTLILLLCSSLGQAQLFQPPSSILSISSFQACLTGPAKAGLDCLESQLVTDIELALYPNVNDTSLNNVDLSSNDAATIVFSLTTVPASNSNQTGQTQPQQCQLPDEVTNKCQITTPIQIQAFMTKPLYVYDIDPVFRVPYAYEMGFWQESDETATVSDHVRTNCPYLPESGTSDCYACITKRVGVSKVTSFDYVPYGDFGNPSSNNAYIRCGFGAPGQDPRVPTDAVYAPPGNVSVAAAGTREEPAIHYGFHCLQKKNSGSDCEYFDLDYYMSFEQHQPLGTVYSIRNPPRLVAQVSVRFFNTTEDGTVDYEQYVNLTNVEVGTSATTADGAFYVAIKDELSVTGDVAPSINGLIIMFDDDDTSSVDSLSMVDPGGDILENPFKVAFPDSGDRRGRYAVPQTIDILQNVTGQLDRPHIYASWFFVDEYNVQAIGKGCGQYGADNTVYLTDSSPELAASFLFLYAPPLATDGSCATVNLARVPVFQGLFEEYTTLYNYLVTCAPNFGFTYGGLNVTTACQNLNDMNYFQGVRDTNIPYPVPHQPLNFNPYDPNMWTAEQNGQLYLFVEPKLPNGGLQLQIQGAGTVLAYKQPVENGYIDASRSACDVSTSTLNSTIQWRVCNSDESGSAGYYELQIECDNGVASAKPFVSINALPAQTCLPGETLLIPPTYYYGNGTVLTVCALTLYSNAPQASPHGTQLSQTTVVCSESANNTITILRNGTYYESPIPPDTYFSPAYINNTGFRNRTYYDAGDDSDFERESAIFFAAVFLFVVLIIVFIVIGLCLKSRNT